MQADEPCVAAKPWWAGCSVWLCGVFEGGGAKGAAYGPALEAVRANGAWFTSVAGSSAGALTAAMVAAGCTPTELREKTLEALEQLAPATRPMQRWWARTGGLRGLRSDPPRLRSADELRRILNAVLWQKLGRPADGDEPVTFEELYEHYPESKRIDLFIVAVDAVQRREAVFNHRLTPTIAVADAAVASAAIPVYFPAGHLELDNEKAILFDGGVWSNFPTWVYKNESFRLAHPQLEHVGTRQEATRADPVFLGFLLDEDPAHRKPKPALWRRLGRRMLTVAIWAFTSPLFVIVYAVWLAVLTVVVLCIVFNAWLACETQKGLHWLVTDWRWLIPLGFWFSAVTFQGVHIVRRKISGQFIPKAYWYWEFFGSLVSFAPLVFCYAALRVDPSAHQGQFAFHGLTKWALIPFAGTAFAIGSAVVLGALLLVAIAAPPAYGLGQRLAITFTSAGSARYWVGTAPDDYVIRVPVGSLGTLDFGRARRFLKVSGDAVMRQVSSDLGNILARVRRRAG